MKIQLIEMKITLDDGEVVEGVLGPDVSSRWGNDLPHLAACVTPMTAMFDALADDGLWAEED